MQQPARANHVARRTWDEDAAHFTQALVDPMRLHARNKPGANAVARLMAHSRQARNDSRRSGSKRVYTALPTGVKESRETKGQAPLASITPEARLGIDYPAFLKARRAIRDRRVNEDENRESAGAAQGGERGLHEILLLAAECWRRADCL